MVVRERSESSSTESVPDCQPFRNAIECDDVRLTRRRRLVLQFEVDLVPSEGARENSPQADEDEPEC